MPSATLLLVRKALTPRAGLLVAHYIANPAGSRAQLFRAGSFRPSTRCHSSVRSTASLLPAQQELVNQFIDLLLQQNKVVNLTAVQSFEEAHERHVGDSLALLPLLDRYLSTGQSQKKLIDVGSGAGLPGVILAIARPQWQWTLLDSLRKRCDFTQHAVEQLGLSNVNIVWARAETAGQDPDFRENFDAAVARAVAELRVLAELSLPFVRTGGIFVAAKGPQPLEEILAAEAAVTALGGETAVTELVSSFGPEGQRTAVIVQKTRATPGIYPRREGRPRKRPL